MMRFAILTYTRDSRMCACVESSFMSVSGHNW